jgi:hypothetical protein
MKIRPVGTELYADGRKDMMRLIVAFRNFGNAPKRSLDFFLYIKQARGKILDLFYAFFKT